MLSIFYLLCCTRSHIRPPTHLAPSTHPAPRKRPKTLILGATGPMDSCASQSLLRSGSHRVYGLARTPAKARALESAEITPVLGSNTDTAAWIQLIHDAHIDVVVDCAGANQGASNMLAAIRAAGSARLDRAEAAGVPFGGPKLGYVYTSGSWVHGTTALGDGGAVNDLDAVGAQGASEVPALVGWRVQMEKEVMGASDVLDVRILRPGMVYGANSWIFGHYFEMLAKAAEEGQGREEPVMLKADPKARSGLVHVEDVGAGIHAVVDAVGSLSTRGVWPVFDLVGSVESLGAILTMAGEVLGIKGGVGFVDLKDDLLAAAMSVSRATSSGRAKSVLG